MMAYFVHRNLHFKSSRAAYIDVTLWNQAMSRSAQSPALTAARHPISIMSLFFVVWVKSENHWFHPKASGPLSVECFDFERTDIVAGAAFFIHILVRIEISSSALDCTTISSYYSQIPDAQKLFLSSPGDIVHPITWKPKDYIWKYFIFKRICLPLEYVYVGLWKGSYLLVFPSNGISTVS